MASRARVLIGIDWAASDEAKCGLARATLDGTKLTLHELTTGRETEEKRSAPTLARWLADAPDALLCVDAPLGWPANLARAVAQHVAGEPLGVMAEAGTFFTRETDRFLRRTLRKSPLEVGADRIARTAFSALALVAELRALTGIPLALAWSPGDAGVIETYPAATLRALKGGRLAPYKKPEHTAARRALLGLLADVAIRPRERRRAAGSDHLLDAIACTVAGADFVLGRAWAPPPELAGAARREGWIWVRRTTS